MKKRIMAIIAVMMISLSWFARLPTQRANASVAAITGGIALCSIIIGGIMGADKLAKGTVDTINMVSDGFVYAWDCVTGKIDDNPVMNAYYSWLGEMFDTGEIKENEDGTVAISYKAYKELCRMMQTEIGLQNTVRMNYTAVQVNLAEKWSPYYYMKSMSIGDCVSFVPYLIYNDVVYISDLHYRYRQQYPDEYYEGKSMRGTMYACSNTIDTTNDVGYKYTRGENKSFSFHTDYDHRDDYQIDIYYVNGHNCAYMTNNYYTTVSYEVDFGVPTFYSTENTTDTIEYSSDMIQGYIVTDIYPEVVNAEVTSDYVPLEDLSDELETILPITDDPTLIIDPAADDVKNDTVVSDIPGVNDVTVGELENGLTLNTTFDVTLPRTIINKFPFSIPWDLYKLITIFEAEPKEPIIEMSFNNTYGESTTVYDENGVPHYYNAKGEEILFVVDKKVTFDFTQIPLLREFCHLAACIGAVWSMIMLTNKLTGRGH